MNVTQNFMLECQQQASTLKDMLYEGDDDFKQILVNLNKYGFLTTASQPGKQYSSVIYQTEYDRYQPDSKPIETENVIRKQRAFLRGYMLPEQANKLYQQLKDHEYIFIRTTEYNLEFDGDIKVGSVLFRLIKQSHNGNLNLNYEPLLTNPEHEYEKYGYDPKLWPDTNWSFNMALLLRRFREGLSEVEIIDRRWNNNEMWDIITTYLNCEKLMFGLK